MARLILLGLAAFLIAMVGATGVLVLHHRSTAIAPEVPESDLVVADAVQLAAHEPTAIVDQAPRDSIADAEPVPGDSVDAAPAGSAERDSVTAPASLNGEPAIARAGAGTAPGSGVVGDPATAPLPERRLAKIFGSMQPREAARVLEQMEDHDVVAIMGMMNDRQAAAVLANLPPQRAAGISRLGSQARRATP